MVKSRAISIIKHLNGVEFQRLGKFLSSPFFNTNKNLIKLYKILKKFYPEFSSDKFTKESLYSGIYEKQDYDDEKLRKLQSELYQSLEKFLAVTNFEKDKTAYNKSLLESLNSKKLDKLFLSKISEVNEILDNRVFDNNYFLEKYEIQGKYISFKLERGEQDKIPLNIYERGNYLIFFFLSELISTLQSINANKASFSIKHEPDLPQTFIDNFNIEHFLEFTNKYNLKNKEVIKIYYYEYMTLKNFDDEGYFYELKRLVESNWSKLGRNSQLGFIVTLLNYCTTKITSEGKRNFEVMRYELFNLWLENKLDLANETYIGTEPFLQCADIYFQVGKIEDAVKFLDRNAIDFYPEHIKNIQNYCHALLFFKNYKFHDALREISSIKSNIFSFKRRYKLLQLKIYYELNLYDEAKEASNNYRKFSLNNKSDSELNKNRALVFIKIYNELLKIKYKKADSYAIDKLKKRVTESRIGEWRWGEKIKEIEKKLA